MKRRFFALLAVPALALGIALASPGTDEAEAGIPYGIHCSVANFLIGYHVAYGNEASARAIYDAAEAAGCA